MSSWNTDDDDDCDDENSYRYTPDDDTSAVNPNTWTPSDDDTSGMWDTTDDSNSMFYDPGLEPVADPMVEEGFVFPLTDDEFPVDWADLKQRIGKRDGWTCQQCSTHGKNSGLYGVRTVDPAKENQLSMTVFETRCSSCTPSAAKTNMAAITLPEFNHGSTSTKNSTDTNSSSSGSSSIDTTETFSYDMSEITTRGFFSVPTFPWKLGKLLMLSGVGVGLTALFAGFTMFFLTGPSAGVSTASSVLSMSVTALSVLSTPTVFVGVVSALYVLHLIDRDYRFPWRFRREVPDSRGAGWMRLLTVSVLLSAIGFTGVAIQQYSMQFQSLLSIGLASVYFVVGAVAARELDNTMLADLDVFEMNVRAWMFAAGVRVGVFATVVSLTGLLPMTSRMVAALALIAPVTAFVYLARRVTSYQHSNPRDTPRAARQVERDSRVPFVTSMSEYHRVPITSTTDTTSVTGQIRARIDCTGQYMKRIAYRVWHNDRLDTYKVTHGKY